MTDRRCPRCRGPVEPIYIGTRLAVLNGSRLYECPACSTAWPERELTAATEPPFCERGERDDL